MKSRQEIFVFGSNLAGIHGAGSAKAAVDKHGAIYGLGVGLAGNSYAIPTKDCEIVSLPLNTIKLYVDQFIHFAELTKDKYFFNVVAIGCGLAGFTVDEIAPMFEQAMTMPNVSLPIEFQVWYHEHYAIQE